MQSDDALHSILERTSQHISCIVGGDSLDTVIVVAVLAAVIGLPVLLAWLYMRKRGKGWNDVLFDEDKGLSSDERQRGLRVAVRRAKVSSVMLRIRDAAAVWLTMSLVLLIVTAFALDQYSANLAPRSFWAGHKLIFVDISVAFLAVLAISGTVGSVLFKLFEAKALVCGFEVRGAAEMEAGAQGKVAANAAARLMDVPVLFGWGVIAQAAFIADNFVSEHDATPVPARALSALKIAGEVALLALAAWAIAAVAS